VCLKTREKVHHHDPVVESVGVLSDLKIFIFNTKKKEKRNVSVCVCPCFCCCH